jgi:hypothetical protein
MITPTPLQLKASKIAASELKSIKDGQWKGWQLQSG